MKRLLYIEDSPTAQIIMKKQLASQGEITIAPTLTEARRLLEESQFDLILADCTLPDGNALDLVRELRERRSALELPIITVSVSMDHLLTVQSLQVGANDCFAKPTPWLVFVAAVERMLLQPYVRPSHQEAVSVTWVEGRRNGCPWVFCPELELYHEGEDIDLVRATVVEQVKARALGGPPLPFVSNVKVSERLVATTP